ncbi:hypothetical protein HYU19_02810 [Candidatus Woesearchaeota archaeon]|nr:hypothetical protein [Candidatus Woesearchaeota archaeon]
MPKRDHEMWSDDAPGYCAWLGLSISGLTTVLGMAAGADSVIESSLSLVPQAWP